MVSSVNMYMQLLTSIETSQQLPFAIARIKLGDPSSMPAMRFDQLLCLVDFNDENVSSAIALNCFDFIPIMYVTLCNIYECTIPN